mgnify:FL=1|tara:strand:- start:5782 stop:6072 length:291 start_codon:yes stop_codon:yes gene_type:complete
MSKQLSRKDAAHWLSEAWGQEIRPAQVRHLGNWLFHHDPEYPNDVDCIHAPKSGDIWAETWDVINFSDSPFAEKDKSKLANTITKLDNEIGKYING